MWCYYTTDAAATAVVDDDGDDDENVRMKGILKRALSLSFGDHMK